jgi:hypothetical protein
LIIIIVLSIPAYAKNASEAIIQSCLKNKPKSSSIILKNLNTSQVAEEDDYKNGYNAPYLFEYKKREIGYAEKNNNEKAIIHDGNIYNLKSALAIGNNKDVTPSEFTPSLAAWSILLSNQGKYLCVSFNFDGIGQSGSYQNVRGGYLLDLSLINCSLQCAIFQNDTASCGGTRSVRKTCSSVSKA